MDNDQEDVEVQIVKFDEILHTTAKAVLYAKGPMQFWVPKSVVITSEDNELILPDWFTVNSTFKDKTPFS